MNFDRLADDIWKTFRKVKVNTRAGCPDSEDGGVTGIEVRDGDRRWYLWEEPSDEGMDTVVRVREHLGITITHKTFKGRDRAPLLDWLASRREAPHA